MYAGLVATQGEARFIPSSTAVLTSASRYQCASEHVEPGNLFQCAQKALRSSLLGVAEQDSLYRSVSASCSKSP